MGYYRAAPRIFHIYVGRVVELTVYPYLREELKIDITEAPQTTGPDQFDFSVRDSNGQILSADVKSAHVYLTYRDQTRTLNKQ